MSLFQEVANRFFAASHESLPPAPSLVDMLVAISKGLDLLEGRPIRHALKIAVLCGVVGKQMNLPERELMPLLVAGLIHDVGMVKIAQDLARALPLGLREKELLYAHTLLNARLGALAKPVELPDALIKILHHHPKAAMWFTEAIGLSDDVKVLIEHHHELCDGSGYPIGFKREEIPLGSRILALADTAEAVMHEVTGLNARRLSLEAFLDNAEVMQKFDPEVAQAFRYATLEAPDSDELLGALYSLDVEERFRQLMTMRAEPLPGANVLTLCTAMGKLTDHLTPQYTENHSYRVAQIAARMAEHLGIGPEQTGELIIAGLLHDIGMLVVPVEVIISKGTLTQYEWRLIHDHPHYTETILKGVPGFKNLTTWAAEHHERLNGSGYHCRKKGIEITLGGRILGVADVFVALTSQRPYRPHAYEPLDALPILNQGRNRLYDSHLVNVLKSVLLSEPVLLNV